MQELIRTVENHRQEVEMTVLKVMPPITITAFTIAGHPLDEWLVVSTIIYTWLQICLLVRKLWNDYRAKLVCKPFDDKGDKQ